MLRGSGTSAVGRARLRGPREQPRGPPRARPPVPRWLRGPPACPDGPLARSARFWRLTGTWPGPILSCRSLSPQLPISAPRCGSPARWGRRRRGAPSGRIVESRSQSKSPTGTPARVKSESRSGSRSPSRVSKHSESHSRSRSKSRSRSRRHSHRRYTRSRSHSHRRRSRSRSYTPEYRRRRSRSHSPMSNRRRHTGSRANPDPNTCLGVFGLSLYTTERDLREVFSRYGPLSGVNVVYDQRTGRSRGFAFVYFERIDDSKEAMERANGMELDGRRIRVDYSITKRAHTPTPGIYMGRPTQ
ncbi:transformer-2 protein homolog alpha isoform X1 [Peromyscus californicus insignis]|uniref:transformer-2 protein homolog alpha isoform X1 n=1 Tax=Peromyscus californicus insignis TaxID=564181 RepID=UPI0022A76B6B|nr:transformer-2 protein homolog alpha isoform X1 [Peromyscus californicus insignis]XP_052575595.1 transformer-2 protein homolog alpha isoform X1 [Peromyscus californicus insignis]XP_052575596.1 transformer-2 protein homolog alpha isoform X1 [Peromyscus californicus insignis]